MKKYVLNLFLRGGDSGPLPPLSTAKYDDILLEVVGICAYVLSDDNRIHLVSYNSYKNAQ